MDTLPIFVIIDGGEKEEEMLAYLRAKGARAWHARDSPAWRSSRCLPYSNHGVIR